MSNSPLSAVVHQLRAATGQSGAGRSDTELLTLFVNRRDEVALAALVERHAPMVWGVCRCVLRHPHDAEDAFQATFLVLVQKAATVVPRELVANWLHGVARQTAVRLRSTLAKRGWREVHMNATPEPAVAETADDELLSRLDEELGRLPERSRVLIVLCDLEGRTRKEVARQLDCPEGTVASGLARARELLAKRLTRRGLAVSGGSLAVALSHSVASADVPASVVTSTIHTATLLAAGQTAGVISGPVATLTHGVLKTMFLKKLMTAAVAVLAVGVAVITGGSLAVGQTEGKPAVGQDVKTPAAEKPVEPAAKNDKEKADAGVAWGKEVGGLQAGLSFKAGEKRTYSHGETVKLVIRLRNVGKEEIQVQQANTFPLEEPPTVTDDAGKTYPIEALHDFKSVVLLKRVMAPGKEIELNELSLKLRPAQEGVEKQPATLYGAGKLLVQFPTLGTDPALNKLATGKLELEVTDKPPEAPAIATPDGEKKPPQEPAEKPKPAAFTIKNVTIDEVDAKAEVVSVSFGNKDKPTKLVHVPLDKGVRVVASQVLPGVANNVPFKWDYVERLTGKVVSLRLVPTADGLAVVSISSGND